MRRANQLWYHYTKRACVCIGTFKEPTPRENEIKYVYRIKRGRRLFLKKRKEMSHGRIEYAQPCERTKASRAASIFTCGPWAASSVFPSTKKKNLYTAVCMYIDPILYNRTIRLPGMI